MIRKGFADLGTANPELAYKVVMDVLGGIRRSVSRGCHEYRMRS